MTIRKQYRSMQGRVVDLDKLIAKNELVPAIGNVPVNARGDELGPGGQITRKREDIVAEYYERNNNYTAIDNTNRKKIARNPDEPTVAEIPTVVEPTSVVDTPTASTKKTPSFVNTYGENTKTDKPVE